MNIIRQVRAEVSGQAESLPPRRLWRRFLIMQIESARVAPVVIRRLTWRLWGGGAFDEDADPDNPIMFRSGRFEFLIRCSFNVIDGSRLCGFLRGWEELCFGGGVANLRGSDVDRMWSMMICRLGRSFMVHW